MPAVRGHRRHGCRPPPAARGSTRPTAARPGRRWAPPATSPPACSLPTPIPACGSCRVPISPARSRADLTFRAWDQTSAVRAAPPSPSSNGGTTRLQRGHRHRQYYRGGRQRCARPSRRQRPDGHRRRRRGELRHACLGPDREQSPARSATSMPARSGIAVTAVDKPAARGSTRPTAAPPGPRWARPRQRPPAAAVGATRLRFVPSAEFHGHAAD